MWTFSDGLNTVYSEGNYEEGVYARYKTMPVCSLLSAQKCNTWIHYWICIRRGLCTCDGINYEEEWIHVDIHAVSKAVVVRCCNCNNSRIIKRYELAEEACVLNWCWNQSDVDHFNNIRVVDCIIRVSFWYRPVQKLFIQRLYIILNLFVR